MTADARGERVAKLMARRGLCSRREAERLIGAGQVLVNGQKVQEQGLRVPLDANITLTDRGRTHLDELVTVLLHKPRGVVSTQPEGDQKPAWQLLERSALFGRNPPDAVERVLEKPWTLAVCGRLDRDSRGLLVLTQDGTLARRITGSHDLAKVYRVTVDSLVDPKTLKALAGPQTLDDRPLLPMGIASLGPKQLRFRLVEGRKHQIRRVCANYGLRVVDLLRESIGPWRLGDLPEGTWRILPSSATAEGAGSESASPRGPRSNQRGRGKGRPSR
jgi:23S rRNA pseudouridine2604 synthase